MTTGRPREFDTDEAITKAMRLFWRNGYEGTSLSDLTDELGITRPSLYAAFGNKEALFLKVLDRYDEETAPFIETALMAPSARELAGGLVYGACAFHSDPNNPPGCLMVHGALVGSQASAPVRRETSRRREQLRERIAERLEHAQAEGDLPADAKPVALSGYLVALLRGIAVEAASGARPDDLRRIADMAMIAWPGGSTA
ncbi:MAG: TetR/AcrR family transcriptional regulator [Rhizobiaceae bacterium]|nr:TetR/AcrR family transcriptional regulator [Rhizobiaceae bacterium]